MTTPIGYRFRKKGTIMAKTWHLRSMIRDSYRNCTNVAWNRVTFLNENFHYNHIVAFHLTFQCMHGAPWYRHHMILVRTIHWPEVRTLFATVTPERWPKCSHIFPFPAHDFTGLNQPLPGVPVSSFRIPLLKPFLGSIKFRNKTPNYGELKY